MRKDNKNAIKEMISDIFGDLKNGHFTPWENPVKAAWRVPLFNPATKTIYSGGNIIRLQHHAAGIHTADPRYMTWNQIQAHGFRLRKGCHGVTLYKLFMKQTKKDADDDAPEMDLFNIKKEKGVPVMVPFTVFNASDIIGIPDFKPENIEYTQEEKNAFFENMIKNSEAPIYYDAAPVGSNYYEKISDTVHLFPREAFEKDAYYYLTAAHEIAHSTGHKKRLNRPAGGAFGSAEYAREELVAELTAAMIRAEFGGEITAEHLKNQRAYLESWAKAAASDPAFLVGVYKDAVKAADYIKKNMIYKDAGITTYADRVKALPDLPDAPEKTDGKKVEAKKTKKPTIAAMALPKKTAKKSRGKMFVVKIHKKD